MKSTRLSESGRSSNAWTGSNAINSTIRTPLISWRLTRTRSSAAHGLFQHPARIFSAKSFPLASVRGAKAGDTYEWPRMFVIKRAGRREGRPGEWWSAARRSIVSTMGLPTLRRFEMFWLPFFHAMGWKLVPLGLPELISGEWSVAVKMPIDEVTLQSTRAFRGIAGRAVIATHRP